MLAVAPSCSDGGEDEGYAPLNLPVISVVTEGGAPITDKENYVGCNVTVYNTDDEYCIAKAAAGIRGRGNSTWTYDKKPYRIKFDKKTSLFGWEKNKSWVLLAMYQDFSNIKDYAAFSMSRAAGVQPYSPEAAHVELLLNGQYMGLYLLTEQVDENKGRADVEEDFSESDTRVPFLVELDEDAPDEGEEGVDYFSLPDGEGIRHYAVKYPKADERYTQQQFDYIKDYITAVNNVCHDGQATEEEVARLIDIPSFINYYLVQELMGQAEINWKSVFMSKTTDGKLVMGPVWDFNWAAGGPMSEGGDSIYQGWYSTSNWFKNMLGKQWFFDLTAERWEELLPRVGEVTEYLAGYKEYIAPAAQRNAEKWDYDEDDSLMDFGEYYDWVINYISDRSQLISRLLNVG